ncbi:MAG: Uncharacterized protein Athens101428_451 [Candidatus Berkelbacteria bacterium Athens1014_28]|uniref:NYN domain-containing protein n=1 Tax=Candidatus Berkelbacteria bacterium Athens1014_28 TaxID=2017145 RepID=A0A554LM87_9BACT|nr:MAG: Uncharacterized protein Athens101428_451 [Candidatus Berkelbacteria bacterium Athens1014_28]
MTKKKFPTIYAFIDSQNLNLGIRKNIYRGKKLIYNGWQLDFKKFRVYLKDKFRVSKAFLFIGRIKEYEKMYKQLESFGYKLVFKPTTKDSFGKPKGNIDAELVLYSAAVEFPNYDKAVIVSGDGDFYCLYKYLMKNKKLFKIIIPNRYSESSLLKEFQDCKIILNREQDKLEFGNKKTGGVAL